MYWKDELDNLFDKNEYGERLRNMIVGQQVELRFKNNHREVGTISVVKQTSEGIKLHFKTNNNKWVFNKNEIKYLDLYLR